MAPGKPSKETLRENIFFNAFLRAFPLMGSRNSAFLHGIICREIPFTRVFMYKMTVLDPVTPLGNLPGNHVCMCFKNIVFYRCFATLKKPRKNAIKMLNLGKRAHSVAEGCQ